MITITEALAEIPTIEKRIQKKQEFIKTFLFREASKRDPHEKNSAGSSAALIAQEMQAIRDLNYRRIQIRLAIQQANSRETITIMNETHTIAFWLSWRREVSDNTEAFYALLMRSLAQQRQIAMQKGIQMTSNQSPETLSDIVVNLDERELAEEAERLENVLGILDGQLSLKNATILLDL